MVQAIYAPDVPHHRNPVPHAAMHRSILVSSAILGLDPASGAYPADKTKQVALAFAHMQAILGAAHAELSDVVKVDLYFADMADRALVNPHWLALYPDAQHRPARHAHTGDLPEGCCLQIEFMAVLAAEPA